MGLGFNRRTVSADFIAFIRYHSMDPAGGTWSDRDRDNIPFVALADFEHIKSGWSLIEAGYPPDHHWDAVLGKPGPKPGKGYKRSLCLRLFFLDPDIGLREWTTNAGGVCAAISDIYTQFEIAPERAQGLVPLVECIDMQKSEASWGTIYEPIFRIAAWQPRPPELAPPGAPPAGKSGSHLPATVDDDLNDEVPFVTCDPAAEPYLKRRSVF